MLADFKKDSSIIEEDQNNYHYEVLAPSYSRSISPGSIIASQRTRGNFILRQALNSYTPECNAKCGILFNTILMLILILIGGPIVAYSSKIVEHTIPYTDCSVKNHQVNNNTCAFNILINTTIQSPVYIYYQLENFHLNHRSLVKSKIFTQLRGKTHIDSTNNSKCEGAIYMYEMFDNDTSKYQTYWKKPLNATDFANPCGLVAKSFFNDTYNMTDPQGISVYIDQTGIANYYEAKKFYNRWDNYSDVQWMDVENEHFIVWMAMETYSSFRKLWGRIDKDLMPGNYIFYVNENYNISQYNSNKSIIISTSSPLGTSSFFGYLLIAGASYCLMTIFVLWVMLITNGEKKFDYSVIKWK